MKKQSTHSRETTALPVHEGQWKGNDLSPSQQSPEKADQRSTAFSYPLCLLEKRNSFSQQIKRAKHSFLILPLGVEMGQTLSPKKGEEEEIW